MNNFDVNLNLYRSFYYVAKYGGFTKASKHSNISQPSLSSNVENVFVCSRTFYESINAGDDDFIYPMILPGSSEKRRNIEQYLIDNNISYSVEIEIPNSTLLKKLILKDMGVGVLTKKFIEDELNDELVVIMENFKNIQTDSISFVYNSKK